jgi:3-hydroxymyristoyl/3-hydroxydecanoyl-(acyl carrier protein) dehydratase
MHYPYNAIFGSGLLNSFEAALHSAYLSLKVTALLGVISVHSSQKDARKIEQGFALGHRNVKFLREAESGGQLDMSAPKAKADSMGKTTIDVECDTKRVALGPRVVEKTMLIAQYQLSEEEAELLSFQDKNNDVFTWTTIDLIGLSRSITEHKLHVNPSAKSRKQKLHKMPDKKVAIVKAEVQRLLGVGFIREV